MEETAVCSKCKKEKVILAFSKRSDTKKGIQSWCKACCVEASVDYHKSHPDVAKRYRQKNKRKIAEWKQKRKIRNPFREKATNLRGAIKYRAKTKGLKFNLTSSWVEKKLKQGCALTGLPFNVEGGVTIDSPSIDQIKPGAGYMKSNCRLILHGLNCFKGTATDKQMFEVAKIFVDKYLLPNTRTQKEGTA